MIFLEAQFMRFLFVNRDSGEEMTDQLIRTPLYDEHLALGARMVDFAGFEMPVQYVGIIEEHLATRSSVGIFDVSHMAEFRISGTGSYLFLQKMQRVHFQ